MLRSPILIFLFSIFVYSCQNDLKNESLSNKENSINKNAVQARKLLDTGDQFFATQKFDSAFHYHNRSKILYELEKDSASVSYNLIQMAHSQQTSGEYVGSEKNLIEALSFTQLNETYKSAAYNLLGISSKELFNYEDALYYYSKAITFTNDSIARISLENNIATVYIKMKKYDSSIRILESILKSSVLNTMSTRKARVLDNLGYCYFKTKRNSEGFKLMTKSLSLRENYKDFYGSIESHLHLAEYYQGINSHHAKKHAKEAYITATKLNSIDERLRSLSFLISNTLEKSTNNYASDYILLNDSITKVRNNARDRFIKIKYDSDQNREENQNLKTQKAENALLLEQQKNRNLLLSLAVGIIIMTSVFVYSFQLAQNKREKIKTSYNTEIRIAKKLHDELANDVYHTMAFAETQDLSTSQNKEILLTNLDTIYSRTRNISRENSTIETGPLFVSHLKEMMSGFITDTVNVLTNGMDSIDWLTIESNKKIIVYRVLQELLVNMKKHSQCSLVVLTFKKNGNKLQIDYTDNGIGATLKQLNSKNGLQNIENRIQAIKGTITFDTKLDKRFRVHFIFPM
ncbi:tetratricopeptide repeat-containing sensor histidine kinase [Flavobacterium sp. LB2P6]|uniref:tetratricopeptide repeat-containing sensor histidine kinase n=1 Tax=Flavobacterium sp. LB2P6 TaxID=3401714 RepID=UPI003AAF8CC5